MPSVEFEPTIPASERPQTHVLDRAATGQLICSKIIFKYPTVTQLVKEICSLTDSEYVSLPCVHPSTLYIQISL
jgi:hypothetical protein